jgi:ribosomal protein S11
MQLDPDSAKRLKKLAIAVIRTEYANERARKARDAYIRELSSAGATVRDIAEHAGISSAGVHKIIRREPSDG